MFRERLGFDDVGVSGTYSFCVYVFTYDGCWSIGQTWLRVD